VDFKEARLHEATLNLHMHTSFFSPVNSVSWWQAAFEWSSVQCSRRILILREITKRFGFRVVSRHPGLVTRNYGDRELGITVCLVQHVLGVRVRPWNQIVPFSLQWKSNESTKHQFTKMLLVINWRYWQS
jgi:hypothetical protein